MRPCYAVANQNMLTAPNLIGQLAGGAEIMDKYCALEFNYAILADAQCLA